MAGGEEEEQAAEGVQVDGRVGDAGAVVDEAEPAGPLFGGAVAGGAGGAGGAAGFGGEFEVDEPEAAVGADHHVAGGEVAQDEPLGVHLLDEVEEGVRDRSGFGPVDVGAAVAPQPGGDPRAERLSGDSFLHEEEGVVPFDQFDRVGCQTLPVQPGQQGGLVPQGVAGVGAGPVDLDVRAGLLDHDLGAARGLPAEEDPALGAVPHGGGDRVPLGEQHARAALRPRPGRTGLQRVPGPGRRPVGGAAHVLGPFAVRPVQDGAVLPVVAELGAGGEGAVPVVDQAAGPVGAVGEHDGPGESGGGPVESGGQPPELGVVGRVDGDELSRRTPIAVTGVELAQPLLPGGELERARVVGESPYDGREHRLARRRGRADVQLPALLREWNRRGRPGRAPEAPGGDLPVAAASPAAGVRQRRPRRLRPRSGRIRPVARRFPAPGRTQRCARRHSPPHPFVSSAARGCPLLRHPGVRPGLIGFLGRSGSAAPERECRLGVACRPGAVHRPGTAVPRLGQEPRPRPPRARSRQGPCPAERLPDPRSGQLSGQLPFAGLKLLSRREWLNVEPVTSLVRVIGRRFRIRARAPV